MYGPLAQSVEQQTFNLSLVFSEVYSLYLEHKIAQGKNKKSYIHLWNTWEPVLGKIPLAEITAKDINYWVARLSVDRKWSPATKRSALSVLSGLFSWAMTQEFCETNPCKLVPRPKVNNERRFVISRDQLSELLRLLPLWCRDLVVVAALTGLRFSKLTALKPSDLRQDEDGDYFLECLDKNGDLHRAYLYGESKDICIRRALRSSQRLFTGIRGGALTQKTVRQHLIPAAKSVGLEWGRSRYGFTFHSLRRAFASHLLNSGVPIERVMAAGNWKTYEAVKRYAYVNSKTQKQDMKNLGENLIGVDK